MKRWRISVLFFLLMPLACNKSLQIDVPSAQPVLVLNGQWQQAQQFIVRLTRSRGINDPVDTGSSLIRTYEVKNAFITIKQNNVVIDTLKYDSINFRYINKNKKTILSANYEVDASVNGFTDVSASGALPSLMTINTTLLQKNAAYDAAGNIMDKISFNFTDATASTDYYLIRIHRSDGSYANCINTTDTDFEKMIFNNPFTTQTCIDGNKLLLSDIHFSGQTKKVEVFVSDDQMTTGFTSGRVRRPYIELLHITRDYFNYIKTVNDYDIAKDNPFAEPTNVFQNVKNGYGFFTAYSIAVDTLR